jgi:type I restriction enzyme M protein
MLIKGQDVANIVAGNTLSEDDHPHAKFDYARSSRGDRLGWIEWNLGSKISSLRKGRYAPRCPP